MYHSTVIVYNNEMALYKPFFASQIMVHSFTLCTCRLVAILCFCLSWLQTCFSYLMCSTCEKFKPRTICNVLLFQLGYILPEIAEMLTTNHSLSPFTIWKSRHLPTIQRVQPFSFQEIFQRKDHIKYSQQTERCAVTVEVTLPMLFNLSNQTTYQYSPHSLPPAVAHSDANLENLLINDSRYNVHWISCCL